MRLVIASRKSDLARIQSYTVGEALKQKHPQLDIQYDFRESLGDKNLNDPLWKMPEKGVFTEDFYQGLVSGKWDMVVHSWKDLPVETRPQTLIAATLPREDVRDVLLFKKSSLKKIKTSFLLKEKASLQIFTSSPRRIYNLGHCLGDLLPHQPQIHFESVRGNVQTRVGKLLESDSDGLVVAKAGLDRLLSARREEFLETQLFLRKALEQLQWMVLPLSLNPTAAAQGALAIEIASDRKEVMNLLKDIHCESTFTTVQREREQLKQWGGGCHQKIGVNRLIRDYGAIMMAKGQRDTGEILDIHRIEGADPVHGLFQQQPQKTTWFERQKLQKPSLDHTQFNAHWVARALAIPEDVSFDAETQLIWVSGVETWKALAQRGVWVYGTSDSMGEQEEPRVSGIDNQKRQWCKWTHNRGESFSLGPNIATYELVPKSQAPEYDSRCEHFYWMSGSSFERAITVYPWLLDKTHWSGPGNTHKRIKSIIENHRAKGHARIALNLEQWQKLRDR